MHYKLYFISEDVESVVNKPLIVQFCAHHPERHLAMFSSQKIEGKCKGKKIERKCKRKKMKENKIRIVSNNFKLILFISTHDI